ncbi:MAG: phospho-N-acetylmuramoyl-pentapeptide-transferase [Candidatus Omnitrophota bacterium]
MIYHILYPLAKYFFVFNVTRYITFRAGCAFVTSFIVVMVFWKFTVKRLKRLKMVEKIDMYGHIHLESLHEAKKGTPTMGGVLIVLAALTAVLAWGRLDNYFVWLMSILMVALGFLGLGDDLKKIKKGKGYSRRQKLLWQSIIGILLGIAIVANHSFSTQWSLPFFKKAALDLGSFYIFWVAFMILATSNAVNFTDGLDGLAIGALITNFLIFGILSYIVGNLKFSNYLLIPYISGAGELMVVCFALVGAGLGFLWFNSYPAEVFMGDAGALALGGAIGAVAVCIKQEFILFVSGGLFVIEALSVILQIFSVRLRGKRIFKAAPLHHHFQILGWKEPKIVVRFWIISAICAVMALLTVKLR